MLKLNTKGFTLVESLLIIIALSLVSCVGFYVYNTNKDTTRNNAAEAPSSENKSKIDQANNKEKTKDPYEGWKVFTSNSKKISFSYPPDWMLKSDSSNAPPDSNADNSNVTSPSGTTIKWISDAIGFGGGCWVDGTVKLTAVEPLPNISGLYYVEYTLPNGVGAAIISQPNGRPKVGQDTGKCSYYTYFDLPGKPANGGGVLATFTSNVKVTDKEATKKILLSLKQNL